MPLARLSIPDKFEVQRKLAGRGGTLLIIIYLTLSICPWFSSLLQLKVLLILNLQKNMTVR